MDRVKLHGRIVFEPPDYTAKHGEQGTWKKVAMVSIGGDTSEYYAWFIKKRYNISLLPPLRMAHVTFINDRITDMNGDWEKVKEKWEGKKIDIVLELEAKTDSSNPGSKFHWWLDVPHDEREELHSIRKELGLGRPYFGLHMTIGRAENVSTEIDDLPSTAIKIKTMNIEQSIYIHSLIKEGKIT